MCGMGRISLRRFLVAVLLIGVGGGLWAMLFNPSYRPITREGPWVSLAAGGMMIGAGISMFTNKHEGLWIIGGFLFGPICVLIYVFYTLT